MRRTPSLSSIVQAASRWGSGLCVWGLFWVAAPAMAAGAGNWQVSGDLARACTISFDCQAGNRCLLLRLDDRSTAQDTAVVTWQCNYAIDTATMEFSSQNQGVLRNADDDIGLPYRATYDGGQGSDFTEQSLVTPVVTTPAPDLPNVDVRGTLKLTLGARSEPLFAGRYTDRITVTITPGGN